MIEREGNSKQVPTIKVRELPKRYLATLHHLIHCCYFFKCIYVLSNLKLIVVVWGENNYNFHFAYMLHISVSQGHDRHDLKDGPFQHHKMREPKVQDSLSWGRRKNQNISSKDASLISSAVSSLNRFANDGSFMHSALRQPKNYPLGSVEGNVETEFASSQMKQSSEGVGVANDALSANQLAAKAIQFRMKGKHEEADKLLVRWCSPHFT